MCLEVNRICEGRYLTIAQDGGQRIFVLVTFGELCSKYLRGLKGRVIYFESWLQRV
jgi:hypothetical protein